MQPVSNRPASPVYNAPANASPQGTARSSDPAAPVSNLPHAHLQPGNGRSNLERMLAPPPPPPTFGAVPPPPVFSSSQVHEPESNLKTIFANDLQRVINGENKLIGYVGINALHTEGLDSATFQRNAMSKGKEARILPDSTGPQVQDDLVIYDAARLQSLMNLPQYQAAIADEGWPKEVHAFVAQVLTSWAKSSGLNELVGVAFDDPKYKGKLETLMPQLGH